MSFQEKKNPIFNTTGKEDAAIVYKALGGPFH